MLHSRLAFVDLETTGLGHGRHRIAEIGVVTLDEHGVDEWTTLLDPGRKLEKAIGALLELPLLPEHLDPGMIDALPERPGVFVFEDDAGRALHIGRAANVRRYVKGYFRLDRQCVRADDLSHRVRNIRAIVADGMLDARLTEIKCHSELEMRSAASRGSTLSIRIDPAASPSIATVVALEDRAAHHRVADLFGLFETPKKARNALRRAANASGVCHRLLGLPTSSCRACAVDDDRDGLGGRDGTRRRGEFQELQCGERRAQHLVRFLTAIAPQRLPAWPYAGPIASTPSRYSSTVVVRARAPSAPTDADTDRMTASSSGPSPVRSVMATVPATHHQLRPAVDELHQRSHDTGSWVEKEVASVSPVRTDSRRAQSPRAGMFTSRSRPDDDVDPADPAPRDSGPIRGDTSEIEPLSPVIGCGRPSAVVTVT